MSKYFGEFKAVNNITFNLYENQIFWLIFENKKYFIINFLNNQSLLGHNGAGKTTTINLLTGMLEKSSNHGIVDSLN